MNCLPYYISILLIITTALTVFLFYKASGYSEMVLRILISWLVLQGLISWSGFYTVTDTMPPHFLLLLMPPLLVILILFILPSGKKFLDSLDIKTLTLLHVIRIPVEVTILFLFIHKTVPQLMTFEGRNFDILSGITAPVIYYFAFIKTRFKSTLLLLWNFICLGLLINIVADAILSAPFAFQRFSFDQPDIAVLYFPFTWLPCCIVPLVLLSHLTAIRRILTAGKITAAHNIDPVHEVKR
jgi:hypothetical protein